ncbi:MAG: tripartite tricarboxylate transporter substrate binding protein [Burkholderiaceae bacterium]|nr:tripartite tricarboxylate transporter substrate binding protein [Burkholderiaceae bacterium]MDO9090000.1 tripartite tricarboxylate transporter substrate binding protein [Burkholderiaceae bacterium]
MAVNRRWLLAATLGVATALAAPAALAQNFPSKPIRIVVPYSPGGGGDTQTRMLGKLLSEEIGQPVIIENRLGSNGLIGTRFVAGAPADGYTLLFTTASQLLLTPLMTKEPGFSLDDLTPVVGMSNQPMILVVRPESPIRSVADLIRIGRAENAKVSFGAAGLGSLSHIVGERLNKATGTKYLAVPYKGTGDLMTAVLAGDVDYTYVVTSAAAGHFKAGTLRPVAVVDAVRSANLPNTPTLKEAGIEGFTQTAWFGLMAPAKTPKPVLDFLNQKVSKILNHPDVKAKFAQDSVVPWPVSPGELAAILKSEAPIYAEAAKMLAK